eukprot:COSAG02_NODE_3857_length_6138_cov_4.966220_1_plen_162_part_00
MLPDHDATYQSQMAISPGNFLPRCSTGTAPPDTHALTRIPPARITKHQLACVHAYLRPCLRACLPACLPAYHNFQNISLTLKIAGLAAPPEYNMSTGFTMSKGAVESTLKREPYASTAKQSLCVQRPIICCRRASFVDRATTGNHNDARNIHCEVGLGSHR